MTRAEKRLVWLLRGGAALLLTAIFTAVMPFEWMVETNAWLGLEPLPDLPLVGYLTRSLSAMYAFHGALLWYVSLDVRKYLGVVRCLAVLSLVFGAGMLWLDFAVGLPFAWAISEGSFVIVLGTVILALVARVAREREESDSIS